jgi:hypothetical protein
MIAPLVSSNSACSELEMNFNLISLNNGKPNIFVLNSLICLKLFSYIVAPMFGGLRIECLD